MHETWQQNSGCMATASKPRLVLCGDVAGGIAGTLAEEMRAGGWDVFAVSARDDLACTILARKPTVVLLPLETGCESGYLVTAKLRKAKPRLKVILIATEITAEAERFANFVGASLSTENEDLMQFLAPVTG